MSLSLPSVPPPIIPSLRAHYIASAFCYSHSLLLGFYCWLCFQKSVHIYYVLSILLFWNHWRKEFEIEFVCYCTWQGGTLDTLPHTNIPLSPNLCQHEQDLWCYLNGNWETLHLHLYILLSSVIIYKPTYKLLRMLPDLLIQFGTIKWYNLAF